MLCPLCFFFFFNHPATTEIYTLSLHDALPIWSNLSQGPDADDHAVRSAAVPGFPMGAALGGRARTILMRALALVLLASCTFEWNSGAPPFPLEGDPPALTSFEKLNRQPAARATLMKGIGGEPWAAFCEFWTGNISGQGVARQCKEMHLHALAAPP